MEKLKNVIKQIVNFIKKYWFLLAMGVSILFLIIVRSSVSKNDDTDQVLKKSKEVKNSTQEKIKEAEKAIEEAKQANAVIKKKQAERALNKKERDDKAGSIFDIKDNDNG